MCEPEGDSLLVIGSQFRCKQLIQPHSFICEGSPGYQDWRSCICETRCALVELVPHSHKNCTEEVPVVYNRTEAFVDSISDKGSPVHCKDMARVHRFRHKKCFASKRNEIRFAHSSKIFIFCCFFSLFSLQIFGFRLKRN